MDIARENGHQEAEDVLFLAADSRSVEDAKRDAANARQRVLRRGDSKADLLRIQSARSLGGSRSASFKSTGRGSPPASFKSTDRGSPPWSQPPSPDASWVPLGRIRKTISREAYRPQRNPKEPITPEHAGKVQSQARPNPDLLEVAREREVGRRRRRRGEAGCLTTRISASL